MHTHILHKHIIILLYISTYVYIDTDLMAFVAGSPPLSTVANIYNRSIDISIYLDVDIGISYILYSIPI